MKPKKRKPSKNSLAAQAGRALRRAALRARKVARMHGTAIHFMRNGRIVSERP